MSNILGVPHLIALCAGLNPFAEPLICDDLKGRGTLLGPVESLPKILGTWQEKIDKKELLPREFEQYLSSVTMWEEGVNPKAMERFAVVATSFLAGRSTSTFDLAWHLKKRNMLGEWGGVLAATQSKGRGQMQRPWFSPRGNLYVSFLLPEHTLLTGNKASVVLAYLLVLACKKAGYSLQIKWPNDILDLKGRKVAGILLEEREGHIIAGLGVNIRDIPGPSEMREESIVKAGVLLKDDGQEEYTPPFFLWQTLQKNMKEIFEEKLMKQDSSTLLQEASTFIAYRGQRVKLDEGVSGLCLGFGKDGGILLSTIDGGAKEYLSGSLSL